MKTVVIGATGHIGTYLVPRLVEAGIEVTAVSRGQSMPYHDHGAWSRVERVHIDREAAEEEGVFGTRIAELAPDVVVDLISYTRESTAQLVDALEGRIHHFVHCGTVWTYGYGKSAEDIHLTGDHISHSPSHSIEKAKRLLEYRPRYTSLEAVYEALQWQIEHGVLQDLQGSLGGPAGHGATP